MTPTVPETPETPATVDHQKVRFAMIPDWVAFHDDLKHSDVRVYLCIARHGGQAFPSFKRIAKMVKTTERSLSPMIARLEAVGAIRKTRRRIGGRMSTNLYEVAFDEPFTTSHQHDMDEQAVPSTTTRQHDTAMTCQHVRSNESKVEREQVVQETPTTDVVAAPVRTLVPIGGSYPVPISSPPATAFDAFWSRYPKKADKGAARKAWAKAVKLVGVDVILDGAERYRDDPNREDQFTKHPATWLNAESWGNPPLPPRGGSKVDATRRNLVNAIVDRPPTFKERMAAAGRSGITSGDEQAALGSGS